MRAEKIIKALLSASSGVTGIVGTRMYAVNRPEDDPLPAIVWEQISDVPDPVISQSAGPELVTARMQVNCMASTVLGVKLLLESARQALHLQSGTISGITVVSVLQDVAGPDSYDHVTNTYNQPIDFKITYYR